MGSLDFEGRAVPIEDGDTVGSALFRAGVRTFNRSLKYHRPRGLYCGTGDCPNCLVTLDGRPGVRACTAEARDGQRVRRETGWPSTDRDLLAITDRMHRLLPVGFYSKTFIRPRFAWPIAERVIRRATGVGRLPVGAPPTPSRFRYLRVDVLVIGGGVAGLAAAAEAAAAGATVVCCDEGTLGAAIPPGPARGRIDALAAEARAAGAEILERTTAVGIYEGGQVPLVGADETIEVDAERIVVATGAIGAHAVFRGNDLPGVWLGRGAARLAGVHGVPPATRAVVLAGAPEAVEHVRVLREAGVSIEAVVRVPGSDLGADATVVLDGVDLVEGAIVEVVGKGHVAGVRVRTDGGERAFTCDGVVVSVGLAPRDGLLRMAGVEPAIAAGDAASPGCTVDEAEASGRAAARGDDPGSRPPIDAPLGDAGYVCLCEDVGASELAAAWAEGWRSSEILKRYTTATMGPCQGAMCGRQLARFVAERRPSEAAPAARTTARPPARPVSLESLLGGVDEIVEKRTALHDRHVASGAHVDRSGSWLRPFRYGAWEDEYAAVRSAAGIMDVGTLGKFLVAGPDARALVDHVFPCRTDDLAPGRSRYVIALDEAGYVMD
ncbi:MAG TPA: 2Fe-2S iron-sulfur cluster-binding protein, partial [Actinomycetota bacterium]|nr:2Fe-2S iron-sulfur cluster-binding protein [Actinomycetota bacterium]